MMPAESSGRMAISPVESQSVRTVCRSVFSIGISGETRTESTPAESWPRKSLTDIRKARNQARALIDEQINPNKHKKTAKAQAHAATNAEAEQEKIRKVQTLTVQDLAKAWLLDGVARKDGNAELQRRFNKDLYPALGKTSVSSVSEHDIRALIRAVLSRGAHRQAISFFADLTQMFGWARKCQPWRALLVEGDPTELVDITPLIPATTRQKEAASFRRRSCWNCTTASSE